MRDRTRRRSGPWLLAAALVACAATTAPLRGAETGPAPQQPVAESPTVKQRSYRGPGLRAFKAGHRAWELHDWKTAIASMAQALKADPDQPEAQVRLPGVFLTPYIPKYYQSHAQCHLGNCAEVRREMDEIIALLKDAPSYLKNRYTRDCLKACPASSP
jgi:hypothetical protein